MKAGMSGSKVGSTASPNNAYNSSKGTGLDAKGVNANSGNMNLGTNEAEKYTQN